MLIIFFFYKMFLRNKPYIDPQSYCTTLLCNPLNLICEKFYIICVSDPWTVLYRSHTVLLAIWNPIAIACKCETNINNYFNDRQVVEN
jgi:hypothetical protein